MTAALVIVTSTWFEAKAINSWNLGYQAVGFNDLAPTQIRGARFFLLLTAQSEPDWAGFVDSKYARQLLKAGAKAASWGMAPIEKGLPKTISEWPQAGFSRDDLEDMVKSGQPVDLSDYEDEADEKPRPLQIIVPDQCAVGQYLDKRHDPVECLLEGSLPKGSVGVLGASGGTGKGYLSVQLGASLAAGRDFFNIWNIKQPYKAFYLSAEESQRLVEIRTAGAIKRLELNREDEAAAAARFWGRSVRGDVRLVDRGHKGGLERSRSFFDLHALISIVRPDILFLDHFAKFFPVNEIDNGELTICCSFLEELAEELQCTILLLHHVSKSTIGVFAGSKDEVHKALDPSCIRGGTGLVAGARWVALMTPLSDIYAPKIIGDSARGENSGVYIAGRVVKKNDGRSEDIFYLKHGTDGFLDEVLATGDDSIIGDAQILVAEVRRREQSAMETPLSETSGGRDAFGWGMGRSKKAAAKALEAGWLKLEKRIGGRGHYLASI